MLTASWPSYLTLLPGIISRQDAEDLLSEASTGSFLVRVSEKMLGYVLSYRGMQEYKHFLIDATDSCYMLLGDQIRFMSLGELVGYHKVSYKKIYFFLFISPTWRIQYCYSS